MKPEDFEKIVGNRLETCRAVLCDKGKEYSRNGDRLHNFKTAARVAWQIPEKALFGMYLKHLVSIMDVINDIDAGILPSEMILSEKITDSIDYHLLLEGLIMERIVANKEKQIRKQG